jgi:hypothetical protein
VALDAALLFRLARALSIGKGDCRPVKLSFFSTATGGVEPIVISPVIGDGTDEAQGLIMPCRMS